MKKTTKRLLAGILGGTLALSLTATALAGDRTSVGTSGSLGEQEQQVATSGYLQVGSVEARSVNQARSAYFDFYQTYGAEKAAEVFYNGGKIDFLDAFPLIEVGTTYVPLAVFAEVIGAEVAFIEDSFSVGLEYKGDNIFFDINDTGYYVNGGERQELPFPTFVANSRTMVPVRFITDVFGLDLYWNGSTKQVIAADLDSLRENSTGTYNIMDSFLDLTGGQQEGQNVKISGNVSNTTTIDGKDITASGTLSLLANEDLSGASLDIKGKIDFSQYQDEIREMLNSMTVHPQDAEDMNRMLSYFTDFELNYLFDLGNMEFYLQSDLISKILPEFVVSSGFEADLPVDAETWYQMTVSDFMSRSNVSALEGMLKQNSITNSLGSVEALVDYTMEMTRYYNNNSVDFYAIAEMIMANCADDQFVKEWDNYRQTGTMSLGGETMTYDILLLTDENQAVCGYEYQLALNGGGNSMTFTVKQDRWDVIAVDFVRERGGVTLRSTGNFNVEFTQERAVSVPESNIYDLSTLY